MIDIDSSTIPSRRAAICTSLAGLTTARQVEAQTGVPNPRIVTSGQVVLLGDSIFDNKAYVGSGPDVVAQLRASLPRGWQASLAAVDGAVTGDIARQLGRVPGDASHLVVSIGGN